MDNLNGSLNPWMIPLTLGGAALAGFVTGKMFGDRRRGAKTILKLVTNDFKKKAPWPALGLTTNRFPSNALLIRPRLTAVACGAKKTTNWSTTNF